MLYTLHYDYLCPGPTGSLFEVMSTNTSPIANLGEDQLLSCNLNKEDQESKLTRVSVTWAKQELKGVVYHYEHGAADLKEQNSEFRGRTELFHDAFPDGNFSLLLRVVRQSDAGVYTCTVSSSGGGGKVNINLRTAGTRLSSFTVCYEDLSL